MSIQDEPVGIPCPNCGSTEAEVRDSRKQPGEVRRIRRCKNCRTDNPTREVPIFPAARKSFTTGSCIPAAQSESASAGAR